MLELDMLFARRFKGNPIGLVELTIFALLIPSLLTSCSVQKPVEKEVHLFQEDSAKDNSLERDVILEQNMTTVQWAAEHYSSDHGLEKFPQILDDDYLSYFPGGMEQQIPAPTGPIDPFTGKFEFPLVLSANSIEQEKFPALPQIRTADDVKALRKSKRLPLKRGLVIYFSLPEGKGYAIIGGAHDDLTLTDKINEGQILVLSNFD